MPSRGKFCLNETRDIIKIIKSIEPNEFLSEAKKINAAAGMNIIIFSDTNPELKQFEAAVQTPYGIIPFTVIINSEEVNNFIDKVKQEKNNMPEMNAEMI